LAHSRKKKRSLVSQKISKLRHEGVKQDQAVAMSLSMGRAHRLREGGKYIRKGRKSRRKARS